MWGKSGGINSHPIIRHRNFNAPIIFPYCRNDDLSARVGMLECVVYDVTQRLAHPHPVKIE